MNLGLFYQSGYRLEACFFALNQFRKFYPKAPVALYEDNTDILKPVSRKFSCVYKITDKKGYNFNNSGRPAFNLETTLAWLDRVYEACTTTLKDVEYVMNFEDDVWIKRHIQGTPPYDLSGINGRGWGEDLYTYLNINPSPRAVFGCGGSIFNRQKFLEAYEKSKSIDWDLIDKLSVDPKPSEWTDSALTLIFAYAKLTFGAWSELSQYINPDTITLGDRQGWNEPMEILEQKQGDRAVIHCWKPYYFPNEEEKSFVKQELLPYV